MVFSQKNMVYKRTSAFTLIVAFVCVALIGLALSPLLPIKLNPSRTLPGFTVHFTMAGASSRVVEMEVTSKLEAMLSRIKGIKNIYSDSGNGWGTVTVDLDKHTDKEAARFEASTIIRQTWAELPEKVSYPFIRMKENDKEASRPFMTYTINAPATPILIQNVVENQIKPRLAQLSGIYKIEVKGATPFEWRLEYDNEQLTRLGISLLDIRQGIELYDRKAFLGLGCVETASDKKEWLRLVLDSEGAKDGKFDPSAIAVKQIDGRMIMLDELVKVYHTEEEPQSYYRINGLNSIYLFLTAEESANQLDLNKKVTTLMSQVQKILPKGYEIHVGYDATEFIKGELHKIYLRTGLTLLILLSFVLLITWNPRYLLLIVVGLAINMAVAIIFYYGLGLEIQLYSLAGITVSLNLVIDNIIVMSDHYLRCRDRRTFTSILGATLTTMGALVIVFFLDEKIRLNLQDFAAVVMINLSVSLLVALFLVPALIDKIGLVKRRQSAIKELSIKVLSRRKRQQFERFSSRMPIHFSHFYMCLIRFLCRWRVVVFLVFLFSFGLPVFMLPEKIEDQGQWAEFYNKTLGSSTYKDDYKPLIDKVFGGTLRLFVEKVYDGSYFTRNEEVVLNVIANMPNGTTLEQMNALIKRMETFLSQFNEVRQFQTSIVNANQAFINVYFKKQHQKDGFPYTLKADIINKAIELGGGSWAVYGLQDQGFSNDVRESAGSFAVKLYGYNYDELYLWAEQFKEKLLTHRRIKEVIINSDFSWFKDDYQEFYFDLDKELLAQNQISASELFNALQPLLGCDMEVGSLLTPNGVEKIKLQSGQSKEYDIFAASNYPIPFADRFLKLSDLSKVKRGQMPPIVAKENQQYRLCLQYEYIGSSQQGEKILKRDMDEFKQVLPMGYSIENEKANWGWDNQDKSQYWLLGLVILIIFFITSILFNSLKQPLAIIFIIPVSYIGVFLTFYLFGINFDQGGFASFILLCGITVNASIYIINEYHSICRRSPKLLPLRAYVKAWNSKITPIFLTIVSTILGFIPFMIGTEKEAFWFPLAAGTIGGLVMSFLGVFLFLPIMVLRRSK